ncbi:uncharacterized protein TNCV_1485131 [Trichonephila clavipes]|nr:uncharacterized protein TNCV_1485131 [Trichonephila clavipes]
MRQIGKGFAGAFKLCSTLNLPRLTKTAFKNQEAKLLKVVQEVAEESMIKAATEIVEKKQNLSSDIVKCGISVDGTWQRRGYTSMNGCVAAISVDTLVRIPSPLNPKNLVGSIKRGGGSVLAWGCKSATELVLSPSLAIIRTQPTAPYGGTDDIRQRFRETRDKY